MREPCGRPTAHPRLALGERAARRGIGGRSRKPRPSSTKARREALTV